jgi:hypothetical protein
MKTNGDRAYKLFHKSVAILGKEYKLYPKGINAENLHAVFSDSSNDNYRYTYAIKVILNEQTKSVETYLAIANPYTHQSLDKFSNVTQLRELLNHAMNLRKLAEESAKATRFVVENKE